MKLLEQNHLELGSIDEMVARIVLLLAVDACVVAENDNIEFPFRGQFVAVNLFVQALGGGTQAPLLKSTLASAAETIRKTTFKAWQAKWEGWKCGFCHFVQMYDEPTEVLCGFVGPTSCWNLLG